MSKADHSRFRLFFIQFFVFWRIWSGGSSVIYCSEVAKSCSCNSFDGPKGDFITLWLRVLKLFSRICPSPGGHPPSTQLCSWRVGINVRLHSIRRPWPLCWREDCGVNIIRLLCRQMWRLREAAQVYHIWYQSAAAAQLKKGGRCIGAVSAFLLRGPGGTSPQKTAESTTQLVFCATSAVGRGKLLN